MNNGIKCLLCMFIVGNQGQYFSWVSLHHHPVFLAVS